jgi:pilus assembly protein FimV
MIITCGNCETSFNLDEKLLKPTGSKVRCSKCKHMFTAYPPALPEEAPEVEEDVVSEEIEEEPDAVETPEPEAPPEEIPVSEAEAAETEGRIEAAGGLAADAAVTESLLGDAEDMPAEAPGEVDAETDAPPEDEPVATEEAEPSLDDLDLAFDTEEEPAVEKSDEPVSADTIDDQDEALDALTDDLEIGMPAAEVDEAADTGEEEAAQELDLSGIEDELEMEPELETADDELEDLDLDFDIEDEAETEAPVEDGDASEEIDLSDIEMSLDTESEPDDEVALAGGEEELDLDLDMAPEMEPVAEDEDVSEELDLSDIEMSLESDSEPEPEAAIAGDEEELDLDLDLDMESEPELSAGVAEDAEDLESEELDFSDFEETVMLDSPPVPEAREASDGLGEDLELDLDLEMADDEPELPSQEKAEPELEDLDFDLDLEMEGDATEDTDSEDAEDVDLSDIEKMLEVNGEESDTVSLAPDADDGDIEVEKWKESPDEDELLEETGEIDLSDIMIDDEIDEVEEDFEDVELELDIDEDSAGAKATEASSVEDIDISGFEDFDIPAEGEQVDSDFSGGDIELEFEVDEDTDDLGEMATVSDSEEAAMGDETVEYSEPLVEDEKTTDKKKVKKKKVKKIKPVRKSGILRPVMILLIIIILPLGAVVLLDRFMDYQVPFVTDYVKQIPYIDQVMKSDSAPVGEISVANISSKFIDNTVAGKLFVITGTVKNEFPDAHKYIKVQGSLFSSGKTLAKKVTAYAGNYISDADLSNTPMANINKRLSNRFGDKKSNFNVKPGRAIPFMVVFSDLPESLEEFTIEVAGSFPVAKQK